MLDEYKDCIAKLKIYNKDTHEVLETHIPKFLMGDTVYIVCKKPRKIVIKEVEIKDIVFTNMVNYRTWGHGTFHDDSPNIFKTKEEAYKYARELENRKNIKFKKLIH